jgi:replicative DNA helicase
MILRNKMKNTMDIIKTGFSVIDGVIGGFNASELVVIAGRPGMRKTSLALSIVRNIAIDEKIPCAYFSLKMNNVKLVTRLISNACNISDSNLISGKLSHEEWERLDGSIKNLLDSPLYIDGTPALQLEDLIDRIRRFVKEHGVKLATIDYLGLVEYTTRRLELDVVLNSLKMLASELNIVIIALTNLYIGNETLETRVPEMADHDEFKAIGQYADWTFFIYRSELYGNDDSNTCRVVISKDGETPLGTATLKYQWYTRRFDNN